MLHACWSTKGGSGTTVVAVALAAVLARHGGGSLLVDLDGDVPPALGMPEPDGPGVAGWLAAGATVPADALTRLEVAGPAGLRVLCRGEGPLPGDERAEVLAAILGAERRHVVVDCGTDPDDAARVLAVAATRSLLVLRPCFLALRRATRSPVRPTGVVLVREPGRAMGAADVEAALGVAVVAEVPVEASVARAVDAGTLGHRLPRPLERPLRRAG